MKRRPARFGDLEFGPVCECGGRKAKQAWTCQRCHSLLRGYGLAMRIRELLASTGERQGLETARAGIAAAGGELAALVEAQRRDDQPSACRGRWIVTFDEERHAA